MFNGINFIELSIKGVFAAIAFGQWPDTHDACRCPPCVAAPASSTFSVRTCDGGQTVSRTLPER